MWLQIMLMFVVAIFAITLLMHIIGAVRYDIRDIIRQRRQRLHPHSRQYRRRPLLSVIILAQNNEKAIERCLRSVLSGSYRKVEIVVIDNASRDATKAIVRQMAVDNPRRSIRWVAKRRNTTQDSALLNAYKRYCHGELVAVINPNASFDARALSSAVLRFNDNPLLAVLLLRTTTLRAPTLTSLMQRYLDFFSNRARKFASSSRSLYLVEGPALFRRQALSTLLSARQKRKRQHKKVGYLSLLKLGNKANQVAYAHDAVTYRRPEASFDRLCRLSYRLQVARFRAIWTDRRLFLGLDNRYSLFLRWVRLPLALLTGLASVCVPVLVTYFVYMALQLQQPAFLLIAWVILGILLLFGVWGDNQLRWYQKLGYTIGIPVTYLLFYILSFVQVAVFLRTALRPRSA